MLKSVALAVLLGLILSASSAAPRANCPAQYTFAVMSDVHIGENSDAIPFAQAAVAKINAMASENNIRWVFITGDLTSTAYYNQYTTVNSILSELKVPWIPIIGNHDTWIYNKTFNEKYPTGDTLFANTFKGQFNAIKEAASSNGFSFIWEDSPSWNPEENIQSWFTNWELQYCGATYYGLDWNSRKPALNLAGYKGAWPGAELHDYVNGTFQWLDVRLSSLKLSDASKQITMLHHHPYRAPFGVPDFIYGFSGDQKNRVSKLLHQHFPESNYWGIITGHWHRWFNGTALDQWPAFHQWETEACKISSAFSLVHVNHNTITHIGKMYGNH